MRPFDFYQAHLDAVSRSFAICIPQLSPPFREHVALSYLLLRVLDTVEDAPFEDRELQSRQFELFRRFMREEPRRDEIDRFQKDFPSLTDGERALLVDTGAFIEDFHCLPSAARVAIYNSIDRMAEGMALYARRPSPLRLLDLEDVVRYCCIVAGLVGELLTRLWSLGGEPPPRMIDAYRFGLFLQKVNILKDQKEDEAAGRFFVPDRRDILASLRTDSDGALSYLCSLPRSDRGYRTFCAWSLMLGAQSVGENGVHKSHRPETLALLERTALIAQDDGALRRQFAELMPRLPDVARAPPRAKPAAETRVFRRLIAALADDEIRAIGAQYG
jgi:phytoene/squalene synthetase